MAKRSKTLKPKRQPRKAARKTPGKTPGKGQIPFAGEGFARPNDSFGGELLKNSNAKTKRPVDSKLPLHVVLRANKGGMRTFKSMPVVDKMVRVACRKHGVRLYKYANVGNHLHLLVKLAHRRNWAAFIREVTGRISQYMQGLKGRQKGQSFWRQRPFTRIVRGWRRAFWMAKSYVELNQWEAEGHISRDQIKSLKDLRIIFQDG